MKRTLKATGTITVTIPIQAERIDHQLTLDVYSGQLSIKGRLKLEVYRDKKIHWLQLGEKNKLFLEIPNPSETVWKENVVIVTGKGYFQDDRNTVTPFENEEDSIGVHGGHFGPINYQIKQALIKEGLFLLPSEKSIIVQEYSWREHTFIEYTTAQAEVGIFVQDANYFIQHENLYPHFVEILTRLILGDPTIWKGM